MPLLSKYALYNFLKEPEYFSLTTLRWLPTSSRRKSYNIQVSVDMGYNDSTTAAQRSALGAQYIAQFSDILTQSQHY